MKKFCWVIILLSFKVQSSSVEGLGALLRDPNNVSSYPQVIEVLIQNRLYYTSVSYFKEYLYDQKGQISGNFDRLLEETLTEVGIKQFEVLPNRLLRRSNAPTVNFILAKKLFRKEEYSEALRYLDRIPNEHRLKPFALNMLGTIYSIQNNFDYALDAFRVCERVSNGRIPSPKFERLKRQMEMNRDYCILGKARTLFAKKDYEKANFQYLDLDKRSSVWPEILFEEAWTSFYQQNYNRTLGKLVTYKAPILDFIFNPEIEVLKALTYMEMCLWGDVNEVVDRFYSDYGRSSKLLERTLSSFGNDYKRYYQLAKNRLKGIEGSDYLTERVLKQIVRDPTFREIYSSFSDSNLEIDRVKTISNPKLRELFTISLKESLLLQRNIIGGYVKGQLGQYLNEINKTFTHMSFIRLEVLSRKKQGLYSPVIEGERARGDIKYLKRNDKQYFWSFNGEFWADELGDYVFALKSEC